MLPVATPELFRHFPRLRERLAWACLARATPVQRLRRLESYAGTSPIWVKRDDLTSRVWGGGKARELEFVFGDLLRRGNHSLLATAARDPNRLLALVAFARQLKIRAIVPMSGRAAASEHLAYAIRQLGGDVHALRGGPATLWRFLRTCVRKRRAGEPRLPYLALSWRGAPLQALGFVNAAYELKRQINTGILPEPVRIYVPVSSGAAMAGLALGCELAGIESVLIGVLGAGQRSKPAVVRLARRAARTLKLRTNGELQAPHVRAERLRLEFPQLDAAAQHAQGLARDLENLGVDAAYGARAMAALLEDRRRGRTGPVLFWHTRLALVVRRQLSLSPDADEWEFSATP